VSSSGARYPSGKGEVCKTFMRRFDSDPRLQSFRRRLIACSRVNPQFHSSFWISLDRLKSGSFGSKGGQEVDQKLAPFLIHIQAFTHSAPGGVFWHSAMDSSTSFLSPTQSLSHCRQCASAAFTSLSNPIGTSNAARTVPTKFLARRLNFILYNPTLQERYTTISIPPANGGKVRITQDRTVVSNNLNVPQRAIFRFVVEC
jgi:hypothetical protein